MSAPQSAGVSAKLDWWRENSFNSASSNYLYTSFREKVITLGVIFVLFFLFFDNFLQQVFEPLMDKLLNDVQTLKKGQTFAEDMGIGALSAGLIALAGMVYLFVRVNMFNKNIKGFNSTNKNESTRVL